MIQIKSILPFWDYSCIVSMQFAKNANCYPWSFNHFNKESIYRELCLIFRQKIFSTDFSWESIWFWFPSWFIETISHFTMHYSWKHLHTSSRNYKGKLFISGWNQTFKFVLHIFCAEKIALLGILRGCT